MGRRDLARACAAGPDGILLPKVERPEHILEAEAQMRAHGAPATTRLWAMIETPRGMLNAASIAAAHPRLAGLVLGTNDLLKDLGAAHTPDRLPLLTGLGLCLLAARAEGIVCVDGVHNAFRDEEGLRATCIQGRDMGFDGKTLIHPAQLEIANEIFAPSPEAVAEARAEVAAFEGAHARGEGVAVLDGRIVENLHVAAARRLLDRASAIAQTARRRGDRETGAAGQGDSDMTILILGLALWVLAHFFKRVSPGGRSGLAPGSATGRRRGSSLR